MAPKAAGLTAQGVKHAAPGRYGDGDGLYLLVRTPETAFWIFRYTRAGRMREMGLGRARGNRNVVTLRAAREAAGELYRAVRAGRDPLGDRDAERSAAKAAAQQAAIAATTFRTAAEGFIADQKAGWSNPKHRYQWDATLRDYVLPIFGDVPVADVGTEHVLAALRPIWTTKPETAARVRGRIESILDYAKVMRWRDGENPATWRGHLAKLLPARGKIAPVQHHPALPYAELRPFMKLLAAQGGTAARALELAILTAGRTGEVLGARWSELDLSAKTWTIPASRMKAGREHRVPLSAAALTLLAAQQELRSEDAADGWVFPGSAAGRPLSNMAMTMVLRRMKRPDITPHGFRSSFRDWAAEKTTFPNELAEAALAHVVADKVEAAYRRGDLFEKRRQMMEEWARFALSPSNPLAHENVTKPAAEAEVSFP